MQKPLNLVLIGPPGSGKGTQATRLSQYYQIPHISTGDLLRAEVAAGTPLGQVAKDYLTKGELVPDDLVLQLVRRRLAEPDTARGFILDGFPRTLGQAQALDRLLEQFGRRLTRVIALQVPDEVALARLTGRLLGADCAAISQNRAPPLTPGAVCPTCQTVCRATPAGLIRCGCRQLQTRRRADDRPEVFRKRLDSYRREAKPLLEYYRAKGLLREVPATGSVDEVFKRILLAIEE